MGKQLINIGSLRKPMELQRYVSSVDEMGFKIETWETYHRTRCKTEFDDRLIREVIANDGINTTVARIFTFRYIKDITTRDRIWFEGMGYEIYGINNVDDENRFLKVWAKAIWE